MKRFGLTVGNGSTHDLPGPLTHHLAVGTENDVSDKESAVGRGSALHFTNAHVGAERSGSNANGTEPAGEIVIAEGLELDVDQRDIAALPFIGRC